MPTWNSRGLRGSVLEEMVNVTNEEYRKKGLALVQKVPTPITPVKFDSKNRQIKLAYFEKKSTVDYIGVVQGIPVCFDAKECSADTFSLNNVHEHQFQFMKEFEEQEGISFLLVYFSKREEIFYIPFKDVEKFITREKEENIHNFKYRELNRDFIVRHNYLFVSYLEALQKDLDLRNSREKQ